MPGRVLRSKIAPRALALLLALTLGLVVGELAIRLLLPQPRLVISPPGFYTADPPGRYRLTPGYRGRITNRAEYDNEIRINSAGLRGPELAARRPDGPVRILAIGDSFTFGVGVESTETFVALLAEELKAGGVEAEGLNAGIPAFGVPDAELWLRRHGMALEPDLVVLAIFLGNDLVDASPGREEIRVVDGLLVPEQSPRGIKAWLFRHSQLYFALKGVMETPALRPLRSRLGLGEPWTRRVLRQELEVYRRDAEKSMAPAVEATDRALARLATETLEAEIPLVALLIPSEVQVDPGRWASLVADLDLDPADYDVETSARIFRRLLGRHSIPFVEPARELADRVERGETVYYRRDRHWTPGGHAVAAEALAPSLLRLLEEP